MPRSCAYVGRNATKYKCIKFCGIFKRKKYIDDIWETCKSEVQIWKQTFLVSRILCRHSRKECEENPRVYTESIERRSWVWSNELEGVYWPVYGWAGKK